MNDRDRLAVELGDARLEINRLKCELAARPVVESEAAAMLRRTVRDGPVSPQWFNDSMWPYLNDKHVARAFRGFLDSQPPRFDGRVARAEFTDMKRQCESALLRDAERHKALLAAEAEVAKLRARVAELEAPTLAFWKEYTAPKKSEHTIDEFLGVSTDEWYLLKRWIDERCCPLPDEKVSLVERMKRAAQSYAAHELGLRAERAVDRELAEKLRALTERMDREDRDYPQFKEFWSPEVKDASTAARAWLAAPLAKEDEYVRLAASLGEEYAAHTRRAFGPEWRFQAVDHDEFTGKALEFAHAAFAAAYDARQRGEFDRAHRRIVAGMMDDVERIGLVVPTHTTMAAAPPSDTVDVWLAVYAESTPSIYTRLSDAARYDANATEYVKVTLPVAERVKGGE